jgi:hypothetical protein
MDKTTLVEADVRDGRRLLSALRKAGVPVKAAMWLRLENDTYDFYVVTPFVQEQGPLRTYRIIRDVISDMSELESLDFHDVMVSNSVDDFPNKLLSLIRLGGKDEIKLSNLEIDGLRIMEALIYEVGPVGPAQRSEESRAENSTQRKRSGSAADRSSRKEHA